MTDFTVSAVEGIGEIGEGADLAAVVANAAELHDGLHDGLQNGLQNGLQDGDIVVVTSKVISKAEGRILPGTDRDAAITAETVRVVARRGPVRIVENRLGLVMAAAGVDASNLAVGTIALLPEDPDASARALRRDLAERAGVNVAVVVSDTSGRAWRLGQTDIAIGLAGLAPLESFAGTVDDYGNDLAVTEPAVADEIAGAAELGSGKLGGRPLMIVRGLGDRVLPPGEDGPGARAMVRPIASDMFGLGAREAVVAALAGDGSSFGTPAPLEDLVGALTRLGIDDVAVDGESLRVASADPLRSMRIELLALAHGWVTEDGAEGVVLRPRA